MLTMTLKMSGITLLYVLLTVLIWLWISRRQMRGWHRLLIGLIYGGCAVLSTHFGIDFRHMMLNVRDLGPLMSGLFFDPASGIIAGLIGGIERYIAGTYWDVGSYTRIACSVSTCLAGFLAAALRVWLFKHKKPSAVFGFILGAVMEVFHMYVVLITHREDMTMAIYVVSICAVPMILFTGLGMAGGSAVLQLLTGEWKNPLRAISREEKPVSRRFQFWLFIVTTLLLIANLFFSYALQTNAAEQDARNTLTNAVTDIRDAYSEDRAGLKEDHLTFHVGQDGAYDLIKNETIVITGTHVSAVMTETNKRQIREAPENEFFTATLFGTESFCRKEKLDEDVSVLVQLPTAEIYAGRNAQMYETALADILLFAAVYTLISQLVQLIVVNNLSMVNTSLAKITGGDLNEVVNVRSSSEFASLSDDINQTVDTLKGYITAAEKRIEQELELARTIQDSALPKNFLFPRKDFEVYATMHPAREVGGDFYDFFFVDLNRIALVIADVSGKGIPAALFMMRAKTAIRTLAESGQGPAEVLERANSMLCDGNDAEMFVTAWLGVIDLKTGQMKCANAGHEYPAVMRAGGGYELIRDRHGLALAAMDGMKYKEYEIQLNPGDRIFVYTDGVPEAINSGTEQYGTERMLRALNRAAKATLKGGLSSVLEDLAAFVGKEDQFDDITMLSFTYIGPEKAVSNVKTLGLEAKVQNLEQVLGFIRQNLEEAGAAPRPLNQILIAAEEIFVNISSYAYGKGTGTAEIRMTAENGSAEIEFRDSGSPFDPLAKADPDVTLPAEERQIGGLGIFMVKKSMDDVLYRYEDGKNILTIRKKLQ